MIELKTENLIDLLNSMADKFEGSRIPDKEFAETYGWGQFLDVAKENDQVGPYGTCAGIIVLSLADRKGSQTLEKATNLLESYWRQRDNDDSYDRRFSQLLRVATLYWAIRLSLSEKKSDDIRKSIEAYLLESNIDGCWGNYLCSRGSRDEIPRIFTSSIIILSHSLQNSDQNMIETMSNLCGFIEDKLSYSQSLTLIEVASCLAAIFSTNATYNNNKVIGRAKKIALKSNFDISLRAPYFFDYEYLNTKGKIQFFRDYYFLPITITLSIAGFQKSAPNELRIYSEKVLKLVAQNVKDNNGVFKPTQSSSSRTNTFDQAWVATLFKTAIISLNESPSKSRLGYLLKREREDVWWSDSIKSFCIFFAIVINATNDIVKIKWLTALLLALSAYFGCVDSIKRLFKKLVS